MFQKLKNLEVDSVSDELSHRFWLEVTKRGSFAKDTVGKQLMRAVDSIGANIAKSYGMRAIKAVQPDLPVALVTAYSTDKLVKEGLEEGAIAAVIEVADPSDLLGYSKG